MDCVISTPTYSSVNFQLSLVFYSLRILRNSQEFPQDPKSSLEFPGVPKSSHEIPRVPRLPKRMASAIYLFVAICLTFVTGSQIMVLNNEKAITERRGFYNRNLTHECDISLDPAIKPECCQFFKQFFEHGRDLRNPCDWFYKCDINNLHCVVNTFGIIATCIGILLALVVIFIICYLTDDGIQRKVDNLCPNLPWLSGRTEANSMEMK